LPHVRTIGVREQAVWIRHHLADFECRVRGGLIWSATGVVRPTPLSREYSLVISYESGRRPRVFLPGQQLLPGLATSGYPILMPTTSHACTIHPRWNGGQT
jgi:hypothetical protein